MSTASCLILPSAGADNLQPLRPSPILMGVANDGVRHAYDLPAPFSYPGGPRFNRPAAVAPVNGQPIYDISGYGAGFPQNVYPTPGHASATVKKVSGQVIDYVGGGFDFSATTKTNQYIEIPSAALADIWNSYAGNSQQFLFIGWWKLPTQANWNSNGLLFPMLTCADESASYQTGVEFFLIGQHQTGSTLTIRRQTAAATVTTLVLQPATADYGGLAQIAVYRTGSTFGARLRTANGTVSATAAAGSVNTQDFSGKTMKIGTVGLFASVDGSGTLNGAGQLNAVKYRHYTAWLENLARSGRDPVAVADADWDLVQRRIAQSAAANGGTSLIFV